MKPVKVGICGLGTVGGGTLNVLKRNAEEITRRAGRGIEIAQIAIRSPKPQYDTTGIAMTSDVFELVNNPEIYPPQEVLDKLYVSSTPSPKIMRVMTRSWSKIKSNR